MDIALLIVRLIVGLGIAAHGTQKLFGWFGGHGIVGTAGFMESLGFRPAKLFATLAGLGETCSGLLIVLGLLGAVGPALLVVVMITAVASVHITKGFFVSNGGWELNALYVAAALGLGFTGFGAYSLDQAFGLTLVTDPTQVWIAFGIAVVIGLINLGIRRPAARPTQ